MDEFNGFRVTRAPDNGATRRDSRPVAHITLEDLRILTDRSIRDAGPRYTPEHEPGAPSIEIVDLVQHIDRIALNDAFRIQAAEDAVAILKAQAHGVQTVSRAFWRRSVTPGVLATTVEQLSRLTHPGDIRSAILKVRRHISLVSTGLIASRDNLQRKLDALPIDDRSSQKRSLETEVGQIVELQVVVAQLDSRYSGPGSDPLVGATSLLMLGSAGTGKTHLLCDVARTQLDEGRPALLVLAASLQRDMPVKDMIASRAGASSWSDLLADLDVLGRATERRSLIFIDAINEGDRNIWDRTLRSIRRDLESFPNVGVVVSCRTPFESLMLSDDVRQRWPRIYHHGFVGREAEAQAAYFDYYGLEAPAFPVLGEEFSNPLFLKVLCKTLTGSRRERDASRELRGVISGQSGFTRILERHVKQVGRKVERQNGLPNLSCWLLLKGDRHGEGIAGAMAARTQEFLLRSEVVSLITAALLVDTDSAESVIEDLVEEGLLVETVRWADSESIAVVEFGYQRFADHLISRHLLELHLNTTSETTIRRSFNSNRPLGKVFNLDRRGDEFAMPGIAQALMLEFPERMRRNHSAERELLSYLPKRCQYMVPIRDTFLPGLPFRDSNSFSPQTERIVNRLLWDYDRATQASTFETLASLATRTGHPYSARTLHARLLPLAIADRDRTWSEFVRSRDEFSTIERLVEWTEDRSIGGLTGEEAANAICLLSLVLTTTDRSFRDRATRALVRIGLAYPAALFDATLASFEFGDPYVRERMLAASYGVSMRLWADPNGHGLREALVPFARRLIRAMYLPNSLGATPHTLVNDYAHGVVSLARRVDRNAIATQHVYHMAKTLTNPPSPFRDISNLDPVLVNDARSAIHMDFRNYTIGRLIPDRGNYQDSHPEYQTVLSQIHQRIADLGYRSDDLGSIDVAIGRFTSSTEEGRVDRYGKKYSWIAFYEMYGLRDAQGKLSEWRDCPRTSDASIDPSFPEPAPRQRPPGLPSGLFESTDGPLDWLENGSVPDYSDLLNPSEIDGKEGPWVLLDATIRQPGPDQLEVTTYVDSFITSEQALAAIAVGFDAENPSDLRAMHAPEEPYTFAGEIPWSVRYACDQRMANGNARPDTDRIGVPDAFGRFRWVEVEPTIRRWAWEPHHSVTNRAGPVDFPSAPICDHFSLVNRNGEFDLYSPDGRIASVHRAWNDDDGFVESSVLYIREDVIRSYLQLSGRQLAWFTHGERSVSHDLFQEIEEDIRAIAQTGNDRFASLVRMA